MTHPARIIPGLAITLILSCAAPGFSGPEVREAHAPAATPAPIGRAALDALLSEYDRFSDSTLLPRIDAAASQWDAVWSRLYWHTDLEQAKAVARAERKPILYLRLLGKLTDEYSCANSRFFRTVLYANHDVSSLLRDRFVLVWETERPVPVVTIDYGDGRVLKRTITGNSIHYVLDADGHVVDALPGLYDPDTFIRTLSAAIEPATSMSPAARSQHLNHARQSIEQLVRQDLLAASASPAAGKVAPAGAPSAHDAAIAASSKSRVERPIIDAAVPKSAPPPAAPDAAQASRRAIGKTLVEAPLLPAAAPIPGVTPSSEADTWRTLGALHAGAIRLDDSSLALMRSHNPAYADPAVFARAVAGFKRAIAEDTERNNLDFRPRVLAWLAERPDLPLEELNARIYSELFLTPRSDPWLGLRSDEVYSALPGDGCSVP